MLKIDCHVHGAHAECDAQGDLTPPLMLAWNKGRQTPAEYLQTSLTEGIERVMVLDKAEITFGLKEIFGDYIIASPMVRMDSDGPEVVDALFQRGAVGIKFMAPELSYGHERYWPLYDVVRAHGGIATFHTGFLCPRIYEPGGLHEWSHYVDLCNMRPAAIDRIARVFPRLKMIIAHFGNPWWDEAFCIMRAHRHVYADFSGGSCMRRPLDQWAHLFAPSGVPDTKALRKLCFGTDAMYCQQDNDYSVTRDLTTFYERFMARIAVPEEIQNLIYRENMLELTRLA